MSVGVTTDQKQTENPKIPIKLSSILLFIFDFYSCSTASHQMSCFFVVNYAQSFV